jgi:N-methylhydantoinase A
VGLVIGVDVGGTFTDFVLLDRRTGRLRFEKLLTTPDDPSRAVLDGIARLLVAAGEKADRVAHVIHGTTLVANALIERKGVDVALVTTRGFRDVLEIGRENRYDSYDLSITLPEPLVPRDRRFEVTERLDAQGAVLDAFDEADALRAARDVLASGAEAVAVCLLHAWRNPAHEQRMRDVLRRLLPGRTICLSSDVVPVSGEYERSSTTVANAYVQPLFQRYVTGLSQGLRALGIERELYLVLSDGGTVDAATAIAAPIRLVHSGPAGGAQAAAMFGGLAGRDRVICFDMGGTTAKACLIEGQRPNRTTEVEIARLARFKPGSGLPLRVPIVNMIEIGAGGGSIARIDAMGLVRVGPDSASSKPGPACYGLGGADATVTDADLVLGHLDAGSFLGGDMKLDIGRARAVIARAVAEPLRLSVEEAAAGIAETVNANMAQAMAIHALEQGRRLADYALLAIGGAGPVHACALARRAEIGSVICPMGPGVASAIGFLSAPTSFELLRTAIAAVEDTDHAPLRHMLAGMREEGLALLAKAGIAPAAARIETQCGMRYLGQGYEVEVALDPALLEGDAAGLRAAFEAAYAALFGRTERDVPVEMVSWRVIVSGPTAPLRPGIPAGTIRRDTLRKDTRAVWFAEARRSLETPVLDRYAARPGLRMAGPAVFEERESTFVVPPDSAIEVDDALNIVVRL